MAGATAVYNGTTLDCVTWTESFEPVIEEGALIRYQRSFTFSGRLLYSNYSAYSTGIAAVVTSYSTAGQTLTIVDPSSNTMRSFGASDCVDDGPHCTFEFRDPLGYGFWVDVTCTGGVAPAGSGTIADTYEDRYSYDEQNVCTLTRTGTRRVTTAITDVPAALDAVDPDPGDGWELTGREGTLDEDAKELSYSITYREVFEEVPSGFKTFEYSLSTAKDGYQHAITLSASGGIDMNNKGDIENMADTLESWAKGKIPDGAKITSITPVEDKRAGTCSITVSAISAVAGDVVEASEQRTTTKNADYVIRKRAGGGGSWIVDLGDADEVYSVSGHKVGLSAYPKVSVTGRSRSETYSDPVKGPDGEMLYRVDYSYSTPLVGGGPSGGNAVGGGGAGAGAGSSGGSSGGAQPPRGTGAGFTIGNVSGFSSGAISGAVGNIAGERSGFASFGLT